MKPTGWSHRKRLPNNLDGIISALRSCAGQIQGVAVESTFNWYWLVDGLQEAGYVVHLENTAAVKQYDGPGYSGDAADARHLAHLLRLGILPEGYIYPREARAVRDLLRKRSQLVRQRTTQILSIQNLLARNLSPLRPAILSKGWQAPDIDALALLPEQAPCGAGQPCRDALPRRADPRARTRHSRARHAARGLPRAADGERHRQGAGADHCAGDRRHRSLRESRQFRFLRPHGQQPARVERQEKGEGNTKCGNRHLAWAFVEAAHFAVRYNERIKRFYQKKSARTLPVVAIKAVAHKLARASYHVMKSGEPFDVARAFG